MAKFSERIGITTQRPLQIGGIDDHLRNALWNWVVLMLSSGSRNRSDYWHEAARGGVWDQILHARIDEIPTHWIDVRRELKEWCLQAQWFQVYELIEFMLPRINEWRGEYDRLSNIRESLNTVLAREMSGYRVVKGELVPITSPTEIAAIDRAATGVKGFEGVSQHMQTALTLLGKKPEPDYRNSIKESISAVEAVVKVLTGEKSSVDRALAILEKNGRLHGALKSAMSKLYGYTSDEDGIRHAMIEDPRTSFAEAKFMLVACSAFVNFLIETGTLSDR